MKSSEDGEVDNQLGKNQFYLLCEGSVAGFFLPANFESDGMTSHKHGLAAMRISKWRPPKTNFFRIAGTSEAKTSVSR